MKHHPKHLADPTSETVAAERVARFLPDTQAALEDWIPGRRRAA